MSDRLSETIQAFDGVGVITRFDQPTGTWMFICLHDDTLGGATGGTRMRVYDDPADGLIDAMRLSRGMTSKWAALDLPHGGAKAVLAVPEIPSGETRVGLLERYGALVQSLGGTFSTGEDMGTTPEDFAIIGRKTRYIHGFNPETGEKIDPGPYTARGVYAGMKAAAHEVFGNGLAGKAVLIQGAGHVGGRLAQLVRDDGGHVLLADIDEALVAAIAREVDGEIVPPDTVYDADCDIYSPCALGATLNATTIPRLRCKLVAGSANNQLATEEDSARLHERGIVYAPDYVVNGGGALAFSLLSSGERDFAVLMSRMDDVGVSIGELIADASSHNESPVAAADRRVQRVLQRAHGDA